MKSGIEFNPLLNLYSNNGCQSFKDKGSSN